MNFKSEHEISIEVPLLRKCSEHYFENALCKESANGWYWIIGIHEKIVSGEQSAFAC